MKRDDFEGPPCSCPDCTQAGIAGANTQRDPKTGKWLHGYALKRVLESRAEFWERVKAISDRKGMR
jgi:hypothetical protein